MKNIDSYNLEAFDSSQPVIILSTEFETRHKGEVKNHEDDG